MIKLSGRNGLRYRMLPLVHIGFRLTGRRWSDFYAWMLDRQERRTSIEHITARFEHTQASSARRERGLYDLSVAESYVDFLREQGLLPEHRILDFGCGFARIGVPLIRYLNPGNYIGVDLSRERIRLAEEYITKEGLADKSPQFIVAPRSNDLSYLAQASFDFIWARAVFGHMPPADIKTCLAGLRPLLKTAGVLIGDYDAADPERQVVHKVNVKTFRVPDSEMQSMVSDIGYDYATLPHWEDNISPDERRPYIRMMRLSPTAH